MSLTVYIQSYMFTLSSDTYDEIYETKNPVYPKSPHTTPSEIGDRDWRRSAPLGKTSTELTPQKSVLHPYCSGVEFTPV